MPSAPTESARRRRSCSLPAPMGSVVAMVLLVRSAASGTPPALESWVAAVSSQSTALGDRIATASNAFTTDLGEMLQLGGDASSQIFHDPSAASTGSWLQEWLASLSVQLPALELDAAGIHVVLSDGICNKFALQRVHSERGEGASFTLGASGLEVRCQLSWTTTGWYSGSGNVVAYVTDSSIGGPLAVVPDTGNPPLPQAVRADTCSASIQVSDLEFSGGFTSALLEVLREPIKILLNHELGSTICSQLKTVVEGQATDALRKASADLRTWLGQPSHSPHPPSHLPGPAKDWVKFNRNPGLDLVSRIVNDVLGNEASANSINRLMTHILGPDGRLSLDHMHLLPLSIQAPVATVGTINLTINTLEVQGLNDWSQMYLGAQSAQQLALKLGMEHLQANTSLTLVVMPNRSGPVHGEDLMEKFSVDLALHAFGASSAFFVAANSSYLGGLAANQLVHPGCLAPGLYSMVNTAAGLQLGLADTALSPDASEGPLEKDVDTMFTTVLTALFDQYADAIDVAGNHIMAVTLRDAINRKIEEVFPKEATCPPPAPTYSNESLANMSLVVGVLLVLMSIVIAIAAPALFKCKSASGRAREVRVMAAAPDPTAWETDPSAASKEATGSTATPPSPQTPGASAPGENSSRAELSRYASAASDEQAQREAAARQFVNAAAAAAATTAAAAAAGRRATEAASEVQRSRALGGGVPLLEPNREPSSRGLLGAPWKWDCLAFHPQISCGFRWGVPLALTGNAAMFLCSNTGIGCEVRLSLTADGQDAVMLPAIFPFSLVSSVKDMWTGQSYGMALLIAVFSGIWPYTKLLVMQMCWFAPTRRMSSTRRQQLLDFLDAFGKWSLVDSFVMVLFMTAFKFDLSGMSSPDIVRGLFEEAGGDGRFFIYVSATPGFYVFLAATVLSLILGHVMCGINRYALKTGEWGVASEYSGGSKRRLCNVLRPAGLREGRFYAYGPVVAIACSLALLLVGLCIDAFKFKLYGLAGLILGDDSVRPYSVVSLAAGIPSGALEPDGLGARTLQFTFFMFSAVLVVAYQGLLLVLWTAPLPERLQRHFLVATQTVNAWNGLGVIVLSIMASVLEIEQYAKYVIGHKCDLINNVMVHTPIVDHIEGPKTCFDVDSQLKPGFFILFLAWIISEVTGHIVIARCAKAFCTPRAQPNEQEALSFDAPSEAPARPAAVSGAGLGL